MIFIRPWKLATILGLGALSLGCASTAVVVEKPPTEATPVKVAPLVSSALLDSTAQAAEAAGAARGETLVEGAGIPGDSIETLVNVPAGRCALLYARASSQIEDVDLLVFAEDGSELGSDEAEDAHPTVVVCPESEQRLFITARIIQGRGRVALGAHDVSPSARDRVAAAAGVRGKWSEKTTPEAWPGLDAALSGHRQKMGGSWVDLRRVALPVDARVPTRLSAEVPAGKCLDALVIPSEDVTRLDLEALDDQGRIIARALGRGAARSLLLCGGLEKTPVSLEVRPESGRGLALLVLSTSRTAKEGLDLRPGVESIQTIPRVGTTPSEGRKSTSVRSERVTLAVGELKGLTLTQTGCGRVDFTPEAPLLGFEAKLWARDGRLLASTESNVAQPLFYCASESGARLDVRAERRGGPLRIDFSETSTMERSEYAAAPLAASRLLAEFDRAGVLPSLDSPPTTKALELVPDRLARVDFEIPLQRCLTFHLALDGGAWGVELRVFDAESGLELASMRGAGLASARACGTRGRKMRVTVEARSVQGRAKALLGSVQTTQL